MTDEEFNTLFSKVMGQPLNRDTLLLIGELHRRLANALRK